jgi:hypothetical protein
MSRGELRSPARDMLWDWKLSSNMEAGRRRRKDLSLVVSVDADDGDENDGDAVLYAP